MAFAEPGFGRAFAALRPVPAEAVGERLPAPGTPGLYVVGGGDGWLRRRTVERIGKHHLGERPAPFRLRRLDGRTATGDQLVSVARTVSFRGGPVVLAENAFRLAQPPVSARGLAGVFADLVRNPPGRAVIVVEWERNPDRRRKDWKPLAEALAAAVTARRAIVLDGDAPSEAKMPAWIRRAARARGLALPEGGAELLSERFGRELRQHANEIEKLALYAGGGETGAVSLEDMELVLGGGSARDRFRFTDALQAGRTEAALNALDLLLRDGESPQALLALLYGLVTRIQLAHGLETRDEPLSRALRVPPRVAEDLARAARRFRPADLRGILRRIAEMDVRLKTTRISDRTALSSLALLLSAGPNRGLNALSGPAA